MDKRMAQIARIEDDQQRWDGYLVAMQQVGHVPNFLKLMFLCLISIPPHLIDAREFLFKTTLRGAGR